MMRALSLKSLALWAAVAQPTGVPQPHTLSDSSSFALLVIDMQQIFADGKTAEQVDRVAGKVNKTIELMRKHKNTGRAHVLFTQHGYLNGSSCDHHANYRQHWAARGAGVDCSTMAVSEAGFDFIDQLSRPLPHETIIRKEVYDAFHQSQLHQLLQQLAVNTVAIAGWETNICCQSTALAAFFRDYRVIFLSDCTDTSDGSAVHEQTVKNMEWIAADAMTQAQFASKVDALFETDDEL